MSDEDALLAAIDAHPDEDTPRLAFADWCDENDRPLRAEFIRLQCALNQSGALAGVKKRNAERRLDVLLRDHRRDLIPGPLAGELMPADVTFERGFLSEVRVTALQFVLNPRAFGALCPAPRVRVRNLTLAQFERFIVRPELELVVSIAVNSPGPDAAPRLAACPHLSRLEALDWTMAGHRIGDAGLEALAYSEALLRLTILEAPGNEIYDFGVERLVASPLWGRLRRLNLNFNQIGAAGVEALADAPADQLEHLSLAGMTSGPVASQRLTRRFGARVHF